jgi:hypothetical protein
MKLKSKYMNALTSVGQWPVFQMDISFFSMLVAKAPPVPPMKTRPMNSVNCFTQFDEFHKWHPEAIGSTGRTRFPGKSLPADFILANAANWFSPRQRTVFL